MVPLCRGGRDHLLVLTKPLSARDHTLSILDWDRGQAVAMLEPVRLPLEDFHEAMAAVLPAAEGQGRRPKANLESLGHPEGPQIALMQVKKSH